MTHTPTVAALIALGEAAARAARAQAEARSAVAERDALIVDARRMPQRVVAAATGLSAGRVAQIQGKTTPGIETEI